MKISFTEMANFIFHRVHGIKTSSVGLSSRFERGEALERVIPSGSDTKQKSYRRPKKCLAWLILPFYLTLLRNARSEIMMS